VSKMSRWDWGFLIVFGGIIAMIVVVAVFDLG
jgi:uncharacterized protein YpmS